MKSSKSKWLAYTVLVGLIPFISRLLVWTTGRGELVQPIAASDLVAFGLVLHISNINELEHLPAQNKEWKTVQNGISVIFIALYSVLYAVLLLAEKQPALVDTRAMLICVASLACISTLLSFSIFHRLSTLQKRGS